MEKRSEILIFAHFWFVHAEFKLKWTFNLAPNRLDRIVLKEWFSRKAHSLLPLVELFHQQLFDWVLLPLKLLIFR